MLRYLLVENFILAKRIELKFPSGMLVLTGETGAGKSVLLEAIAFLLGKRSGASVVREGARKAIVVALFSIAKQASVQAFLQQNDLEAEAEETELSIKRVMDADGRSKVFINGRLCTLFQLKQLSPHLMSIHGQHAFHTLVNHQVQQQLFDEHLGLSEQLTQVRQAWKRFKAIREKFLQAQEAAQQLEQKRLALQAEIQEIEALALTPAQWSASEQQFSRLAHSEQLVSTVQSVLRALQPYDGVDVLAQVQMVVKEMQSILPVDPSLKEPLDLAETACVGLSELTSFLNRYVEGMEVDEETLQQLGSQIQAVQQLAKRFLVEPEALSALAEEKQMQLSALEAADAQHLGVEMKAAHLAYQQLAQILSQQRLAGIETVSGALNQVMQELNFRADTLKIVLEPKAADEDGWLGSEWGDEQVAFLFAPNVGMAFKPLAQVASGGELSRVSLAIQVVMGEACQVPTLFFDEVDTGVSGRVADSVGRLLRSIAQHCQVCCVTHLPQVAVHAQSHWLVQKYSDGLETQSQIEPLTVQRREEVVAAMLTGGGACHETSLTHAREMLRRCPS